MAKISRRKFIGGVAIGGVGLAAGTCYFRQDKPAPFLPRRAIRDVVSLDPAFTSRPPNIILVNCDDLGYGDLGCYGSTAVKTPHIDALAAQGVRFTDFHACDSVCTPSRAGLLTGRYPKRMRLDFPLFSGATSLKVKLLNQIGFAAGAAGIMDMDSEVGAEGLNPFEIALGDALQQRGYRTAMIGKWHLGDFIKSPQFHPMEHGFQSFYGVPHSNDMTPFPLYRDRETIEAEITDRTKLSRIYTDEAIKIVESSKDKPFFLYLAHTYPHRPLAASAQFKDSSAGGLYGDAVEEIDWNFGRLMDTLKKAGQEKNTIVIFTSDNGPWYDGSPAGFRGRKGQSFEGGHRVPMIVRWDGMVPRGQLCDSPAMNIDVFPTLLGFAGVRTPSDRIIDGLSMASLLTHPAEPPATPRELYFYHQGTLESMRAGEWKFIRKINHYVWPLPVNAKLGWLTRQTTGPLPLLYNLKTDPGEAYNLAGRFPDRVRDYTARMERWDDGMKRNLFGVTTTQ